MKTMLFIILIVLNGWTGRLQGRRPLLYLTFCIYFYREMSEKFESVVCGNHVFFKFKMQPEQEGF